LIIATDLFVYIYTKNVLNNTIFISAIIIFFVTNGYCFYCVYRGFNIIEHRMIIISKRLLVIELFSCAYFIFSAILIIHQRIFTNVEFFIKLINLCNLKNKAFSFTKFCVWDFICDSIYFVEFSLSNFDNNYT